MFNKLLEICEFYSVCFHAIAKFSTTYKTSDYLRKYIIVTYIQFEKLEVLDKLASEVLNHPDFKEWIKYHKKPDEDEDKYFCKVDIQRELKEIYSHKPVAKLKSSCGYFVKCDCGLLEVTKESYERLNIKVPKSLFDFI